MANYRKGGAGDNVNKGSGSKKGATDTGSVGDLHTTSSVSRNETSHNVDFAEGGDTPMFGKQAAGPQDDAVTSHEVSGGAPGAKFAEGGKGKMFGFQGSLPARAGITSAR